MSNVIQFRPRDILPDAIDNDYQNDDSDARLLDACEIDLLSAVDIAIRDLREITATASATAQTRARECLSMLEDAYAVATRG